MSIEYQVYVFDPAFTWLCNAKIISFDLKGTFSPNLRSHFLELTDFLALRCIGSIHYYSTLESNSAGAGVENQSSDSIYRNKLERESPGTKKTIA